MVDQHEAQRDEAWRWTAQTVAARIRSGEESCRDVVDSVLSRIDLSTFGYDVLDQVPR